MSNEASIFLRALALLLLIAYAATSFIAWDANPGNWGWGWRMIIVILSAGSVFLAAAIANHKPIQ